MRKYDLVGGNGTSPSFSQLQQQLSDGRRPDRVTLTPWNSGHLLVWDATCPDTFNPSYRAQATQGPGKVAAAAEERKEEKYHRLPPGHYFSPVAIETMGAVGLKPQEC